MSYSQRSPHMREAGIELGVMPQRQDTIHFPVTAKHSWQKQCIGSSRISSRSEHLQLAQAALLSLCIHAFFSSLEFLFLLGTKNNIQSMGAFWGQRTYNT